MNLVLLMTDSVYIDKIPSSSSIKLQSVDDEIISNSSIDEIKRLVLERKLYSSESDANDLIYNSISCVFSVYIVDFKTNKDIHLKDLLDLPNSVPIVYINELPSPPSIKLQTLSGEIIYNGSMDELLELVLKRRFNENGFGSNYNSMSSIYPIYIIGVETVKNIRDLVNLIDWSNPEPIIQVIFVKGSFRDDQRISYHKWYEYNNLALTVLRDVKHYDYFHVYAIRETIPKSWISYDFDSFDGILWAPDDLFPPS